jgi:hypothetical protein
MPKSITDPWVLEHPDDYIFGYRADPTNKFGGKTGLETQPKYFDRRNVASYLKGMATARDKFGMRHPDPETLTNLLLKEGRDDFGVNGDFPGTPEGSKRYAHMVKTLGVRPHVPDDKVGNLTLATVVDEHMRRADAKGLPLPRVWNGGGKKAAQYNKDFEAYKYAATHPKNAELYNFVKKHLGLLDEQKPTSAAPADVPVELPDDYRKGGRVRMI